MAERRRETLAATPAGKVFLDDGFVPEPGYRLRQPALATTLQRLAAHGRDGFYGGPTARQLVDGVRTAGGIWSLRDLREYRVVEREPVVTHYHGLRITSAPPPSSGGVVLAQMLAMLEGEGLVRLDPAVRTERIVEAMRRAYRDRARYLGDPDFVAVDVRKLTSPAYAAALRAETLTPASGAAASGGTDTTHFSVIDRDGNRVAVTLSLNTLFGSAFMPPGTGVLLNNEMDDFVAKPGVANTYGLVGGAANAIAPGKRPLSSMTPTFVETPDAVVVLGTPGGSRIITMVMLAVLEIAEGRGGPAQWVSLPRFHHQYLPDVVEYEPAAFDEHLAQALEAHGYRLQARAAGYGNMQALAWYKKARRVEAASDPRGEGAALVW
jgi:gamma-glutamyltranspeptidase/glutathione hydrolase